MKEPSVQYTSTGCEIVYQEVGKRTGLYHIELTKKDGKLIARRIND